jgi:hypothetical protein
MSTIVQSENTRVRVAVHPPELPHGVIVFYDAEDGRRALMVPTEPRWVGWIRWMLAGRPPR